MPLRARSESVGDLRNRTTRSSERAVDSHRDRLVQRKRRSLEPASPAARNHGRRVTSTCARHAGSKPFAAAHELRDDLLLACREILLGVATPESAALGAHIDSLLDLDDGASPGSQR